MWAVVIDTNSPTVSITPGKPTMEGTRDIPSLHELSPLHLWGGGSERDIFAYDCVASCAIAQSLQIRGVEDVGGEGI